MDKKSIRAKIKEKKAMLSQEEIQLLSLKIAEKFFELSEYKNADTVFVYMSYNQEVETGPIMSRAFADGKRIALPRVKAEDGNGRKLTLNEQTMEFVFIDENTVFIENGGIKEPTDGPVADCGALVIVPGLAFGKDSNRIGYGGGFYDRYFASHKDKQFIKAALCYEFQVYDELPSDEHDEKVDVLITPENTIYL